MKAFYLVSHKPPEEAFELRDAPIPTPAEDEVRIRVTAFGLNYADIMARQGLYRGMPPLPCVLGYDVEGVIDEVGSAVTNFMVGDPVFALTRFGGYAQYAVTSATAVGHLPADAPIGIGCALATQSVTACHAAMHVQTLMEGEKVLVHAAAGGLGTALIQIAQSKGCITIGVAGGKDKVTYLKSLGVDHIIDHREGDYLEYVRRFLDGRVDVVFDNIGGKSVKEAKSILASGGRIITLGAAALSGKKGIINLLRLVVGFGWFSPISFMGKSQSLIGINMLKIADHRPDIIAREFRQVELLYEEGILKPHVGKVFKADDLALAHREMENRKSIGKLVVQW